MPTEYQYDSEIENIEEQIEIERMDAFIKIVDDFCIKIDKDIERLLSLCHSPETKAMMAVALQGTLKHSSDRISRTLEEMEKKNGKKEDEK